MILRVLCVLVCCLCPALAQERVYQEALIPGGKPMKFAIVLPDGFDAAKPTAVLLALPPGDQNETMVDAALTRYWEAEAKARGWVVVSPVAPAGVDFASADISVLVPLMGAIKQRVMIRSDKLHIAGVSNGGRAALHMARQRPEWFASVLVLPGFFPSPSDERGLEVMRGIPVAMLVGGKDADWVAGSRRALEALRAAGVRATLDVLEGQTHVLDVPPARLFNMLEEAASLADPASNLARVNAALDDLHDAAAKADEVRYFRRFTKDAVFIGTDATERWTKAEFQKWARPYFARGTAWKYTPRDRHVFFSTDGGTAWFDEFVDSEKLGACRGTGVLQLDEGEWRVAQYHLVIPVPNDLADDLVKKTKDLAKKAK